MHIYQKALTSEQINDNTRTDADDGAVYWMDFGADELKSKSTNYHWLDDKLGENTYWGYGGDWMDYGSNADAFCADAIVFADRTPTAKLDEVKKVHQQVNFYDDGEASQGMVRVVNEFENTGLNQFDITWKLTEDTKVLKEGTLNLSAAPLSEETIPLDLPEVIPKAGSVYLLEFSVQYKDDNSFSEVGDELAFEQIPIDFKAPEKSQVDITEVSPFANVQDGSDELTLTGTTDADQPYSLTVNKSTGVITNYSLDGKTVLEKGPVPSFWRAQTYNDSTNIFPSALRNAEDTMENIKVNVVKNDNNKLVSITVSEDLQVDASSYITYDIYGNGEIVVCNQFVPHSNFAPGNNGQATLPRVGMRMQVAPDYEQLEYYGRGPDENYCDRKTGSKLGVYQSTVDEQFQYKYLKPQENGNHTDVRWTSLTNEDGDGLMVSAENTMETTAQHYTAEELNPSGSSKPYESADAYRHPYQVPMREDTIWNIDYMQRGVSDTAFMGHVPLAPYRLDTDKTYTHAFRISPVAMSTDKMSASKTAVEPSAIENPITDIKVDGTSLKGFDPFTYDYNMEIPEGKSPVVTVDTAISSMKPVIEQTGSKAVIKAELSSGETITYTIHFTRVKVAYLGDLLKDTDPSTWIRTGGGDITIDETPLGDSLSVKAGSANTVFDKGISFRHKDATYDSRKNMTLEIPIERKGFERFKTFAGADSVTPNWGRLKIDVKTTDGETTALLSQTGWITGSSAVTEVNKPLPANAKSIVLTGEMDNASVILDFADAKFVNAVEDSPVDKSGLQEVYDLNKDKQKGDYTDTSWAAFVSMLADAKSVLENDDATQAEVDAAKNGLDAAIRALTTNPGNSVDNASLLTLYNANKDKQQGSYTDASWAAFVSALANAKLVLDNENATQNDVNTAKDRLMAAVKSLTVKSNNSSSKDKDKDKPAQPVPAPTQSGSTIVTGSGTFITDTTTAVHVKGSYTAKLTSKSGGAPKVVIGTSGVFDVRLTTENGIDYFVKLIPIGQPGAQAGVYLDGVKLFVATVEIPVSTSTVKSDTTQPFKLKAQTSYTFKLTADTKPTFVCGTAGVFKVEFVRSSGKDYYFRITPTSRAGASAGFYINSERTPVTVVTVS